MAVNSCLTLVGSILGGEVVSVEGVAAGDGALHPVQVAMAEGGGSQCGYCTPGFVVSMFTEYYRRDRPAWDPESIAGNLCRCTGYRPIRDAMRSLGSPREDDPHHLRLGQRTPKLRGLTQLRTRADGPRKLLRPDSLDALLDALDELRTIEAKPTQLRIGAAVTLSELEHHLAGRVPMLAELFPLFSSRLIRNRATLGGNLANASPIGDSPPALLALDASVVLRSAKAEREVPLAAFFTGYRQTVRAPDELLTHVVIPTPDPSGGPSEGARHGHFYKVSKRVLDDISTVAAGLAVDLDADGVVTRARLAFGGVAATPARALAAEAALLGQPWTRETVAAVAPTIADDFTPMTDHRGSAEYRRAMCGRLLEKFFHETQTGRRIGPQPPPTIVRVSDRGANP